MFLWESAERCALAVCAHRPDVSFDFPRHCEQLSLELVTCFTVVTLAVSCLWVCIVSKCVLSALVVDEQRAHDTQQSAEWSRPVFAFVWPKVPIDVGHCLGAVCSFLFSFDLTKLCLLISRLAIVKLFRRNLLIDDSRQ